LSFCAQRSRFDDVEVELGKAVVLIGRNNSGKTTVLQALALWDIGVRRWNEKRKGKPSPEKRPGVTINRRDLVSIPVPHANLLWRALHVRDVTRVEKNGKPSPKTQNVRVELIVAGVTREEPWSCGLELDYANEESFYCRPLTTGSGQERMPVPDELDDVRVAFLPPMSGLADREFLKQRDRRTDRAGANGPGTAQSLLSNPREAERPVGPPREAHP